MEQQIINNYFQQLAKDFKPIAHDPEGTHRFATLNEDSIAAEIRDKLNFNSWCMLLEETTPKIKANGNDALFEYREFRYTICKSVTRYSDAEKEEVFRQAEILCRHIFAKLLREHRNSRRTNTTSFPLFDLIHEVDFEKYMDILNEDICGIDAKIQIKQPFQEQEYNNPELWN